MGDQTGEQSGKQSQFGCAQAAGIGCLVLIVLGLVSGLVVCVKWKDWARTGAAALAEAVSEELMGELGLSETEKEEAMEPIREFTQRIRDGEVSVEQGVAVMEALTEGPAFAVLLALGFERKYLAASTLSEADKQQGHVTITRFVQGVSTEKIPRAKVEEISDIVSIKTTDSEGKTTHKLKESITAEELTTCMNIMKEAADGAGIEEKEFTFDLGEQIREAIEKGMSAPRCPEDAVDPTGPPAEGGA